jgi:hypothetical protein
MSARMRTWLGRWEGYARPVLSVEHIAVAHSVRSVGKTGAPFCCLQGLVDTRRVLARIQWVPNSLGVVREESGPCVFAYWAGPGFYFYIDARCIASVVKRSLLPALRPYPVHSLLALELYSISRCVVGKRHFKAVLSSLSVGILNGGVGGLPKLQVFV